MDERPRWLRLAVYIVITSLGVYLLLDQNGRDHPNYLMVGAALVLLGLVPAAALDRWMRGGGK